MKLGIVGAGTIVKEYLPYMKRIENLEVSGILGTRPDAVIKFCEDYGISCATTDFNELCACGIDTVYVAVPNHLHFEYCRKALQRGLNVIVEKPFASNYTEVEYLVNLAKSRRLFIFEAVTTLYMGSYYKIKEWLAKIGTIKMIQSNFSQYSRRYDAFRSGKIMPVFDPEKSGGALMDLNCYNLHFVMGLFGNPDSAKYYANIEKGIDTSGVLIMEYPSFVATCMAAKDSNGLSCSVIQGTEGIIKTACSPSMICSVTLKLNDGTVEEYDDGMAKTRLIPEFNAFIRAIHEKDYDFCYRMLDESLAVSRVMTKARLEAGIYFPADK